MNMSYELQKASIPKRIAAFLIDLILLAILASGAAWVLTGIFGYDEYAATVEQAYEQYGQAHGVNLMISQEEYNALTPELQAKVDAGFADMNQDQAAIDAFEIMQQLILINASLSILFGTVVVEIVFPLIFKNGQTVGKKVFSLSVIHRDGIQINGVQLFTRSILGKYAVELMIPAYALLALFFGIGIAIMILLAMLVIVVQLGCLLVTRNNSAIHDLMSGTVVVDHSSQMIFKTPGDLINYQKKVAAERASRQPY